MNSILLNYYLRNNKIDAVCFDEYLKYLKSISGELPVSAYGFATAEWHYDITHHMCPHDSWIESVKIDEISSGSRREIREINIELVCLGAFHDGNFTVKYKNVTNYCLTKKTTSDLSVGHGDWLLDEISLSAAKKVEHDILLSNGSRMYFECDDISYLWKNCMY